MEASEEKKASKFTTMMEEHPHVVFWTRFVLWASCACVLPFLFIAYRFRLFQNISKMNVGGWGLIAILIVAIFALVLVKYVLNAFSSKYSFIAQCLSAFCKVVIPLVCLYAMLYSIRDNIDAFLQALGCTILCEIVAIPINPMPKWVYEMQKNVKDSEKKDTIDYLLNEFFKRKKDSGGE